MRSYQGLYKWNEIAIYHLYGCCPIIVCLFPCLPVQEPKDQIKLNFLPLFIVKYLTAKLTKR